MENLEPLRLFAHLAGTLHYGRTALECHVSPSALSRTIQRLEQQSGTQLFVRDRRRVELTREGAIFLEYANEVLDGWESFARDVSPNTRLEGTIRVFCTVTASQSFLPASLGQFRESHPDVHIQLETGYAADALDALHRGDVDVSIAALPERVGAGIATRLLATTPLLFVAPSAPGEVSRATRRRQVDWAAIPMILPPWGPTREAVDRWFRSKRIRTRLYAEIQSHEAILSLTTLGCGVGVVPALVLEKSPLRATLRTLDVSPRMPDLRVAACALRRNLTDPIVAAFWIALPEG